MHPSNRYFGQFLGAFPRFVAKTTVCRNNLMMMMA